MSIALFVAVVPLLMSATQSLRVHERTLNDILVQLHATSAQLGARAVHQYLEHIETSLRNTVQGTIDWESLTVAERHAALQLLAAQLPDALLVTLDQRNGSADHVTQRAEGTTVSSSPEDVSALRRVLPPSEGNEVTVGRAIRLESGSTLLPLSVTDRNPAGQLVASVGVGLSMQRVCATLHQAVSAEGSVILLDQRNEVLCKNGSETARGVADVSLIEAVKNGANTYSRQTEQGEIRGAMSHATDNLKVVVEQPLALLSAPTRALRRQVALWLAFGAAAALISAGILGRSILLPLERLASMTRKIGQGLFTERVDSTEFDAEFADLASSLNTMASAIAERDQEIKTWNQELQNRIEERSRELEAAQDALLSSRKMAGLSVTTAGVAHELNNPLTGVLGLAQVLAVRLGKRHDEQQNITILQSIVTESKRMQALLERMKVLHGDAEQGSYREVNCTNLIEGALLVRKREFEDAALTVRRHFDGPLHVWGHLERLHMIFVELIENAYRSVREFRPVGEGQLTLSVQAKGDDWVEVAIQDNGQGIRPEDRSKVFEPFFTTKPGGIGQGLGLAQVYRMVETHAGKVWVDSALDSGCRVVVRLPRARVGAHLS